jgi:DNA-binding NtrC family response regulator
MVSPALDPMTGALPPGGGEIRVLIVDDEPAAREVLRDCLLEHGYQVTTAASGQQALEAAEQQFFHVAILDIRLPDMFGTEVLERLKELQPDTACVMVTGYASLQTAMKALNGGASAYVIKPLNLEHLFGVVDQAVDRQRSRFEERRLLGQYRELEERAAQLAEQVRRLEQENAALRQGGPAGGTGTAAG